MKIYVGNLSYETTEDDLKQEFGAFGQVASVSILADKETGRPRGFGFVEMSSDTEAKAAIAGLNGKVLKNRTVVVSEARARSESGPRRGGSGGGPGGGGRERRY